ncbi:hypothetical protein [Acinetobacter phage vB_AbaM_IME512]|uniref:Transcriptional regulator n=1 Tax=Acinetobacter phage P919 TaxID=3229763 RepID=A0AB39AIX5_9CAUD|nr:hypothetical protein [Acinetobacter phage vB_AbaM_IME512]
MKIENIAIVCKDLNQRDEAEKLLKFHGLRNDMCPTGDQNITVGFGQTFWFSDFSAGRKISFDEFMQRYSENDMIKKIHQAKKELGLNNSELSLKMGKSRPYIAKMLNQPQSEKVQNKVIKEIDELLEFEQRCKEKEYARCASELNIPVSINDLSVQKHQDGEKDKEISDLKKIIKSKDLAISGLIKQNDEAKKIHDKDINTLVEVEGNLIGAKIDLDRTKVELDYFVNQYKQSEEDVNSLKSKIKRERIIILIVIAILTALFFLKGSIGG